MSAGRIAPSKLGMKSTEYIHTKNNKIIFKIGSLWAPMYHYYCGQMGKTLESHRRSSSSTYAITQPNHNIFFCIPVKLPNELWYHKRKEYFTIYDSSPVLTNNVPLTYPQPQVDRPTIKLILTVSRAPPPPPPPMKISSTRECCANKRGSSTFVLIFQTKPNQNQIIN